MIGLDLFNAYQSLFVSARTCASHTHTHTHTDIQLPRVFVRVRCIKPNMEKQPNHFNDDAVTTQLRYTGVMETTAIRRQG